MFTAARPSVAPAGASSALSLFRFSLALMVMAEHLSGSVPAQTGRLAVEAFFCISGFLISMVATTRYAGRPAAFLANRFLRIYPTYWACLGVGLVVVLLVPTSPQLHPSLLVPQTAADWVANLAVFGLTQDTTSRLLPAAWSLHTELWFYLVIGLLTAARPRLTFVLLPVSLAVSAYCAFWWAPVAFYGTPVGNADAFFIGSVVFLLRERLAPRRPELVAGAALLLFEFLAWGPFLGSQSVNEFLGAPAAGLFLLGLWNSRIDAALTRFKPMAAFLGRLSYPLFLLHWPLGALAAGITGLKPGVMLLALGGALSFCVAILVLWFVEDPLVRLRRTVRDAAPVMGEGMPAISD
ncbi:MAG TPA: acyltransferase [Rhizomicrobium sp.]|jgi:peptidoglycan/LPS O-acetylase OafA/YrhL|nr:acyltransferase [Rhizomicrobium sp.]